MFRRRRETDDATEPDVEPEAEDRADDRAGPTQEHSPGAARPQGPYDASDAPEAERVDFGALLLPGIHGLEMRVDADADGTVIAVTAVRGESAVQMQAFAAPKSLGIWDDVRGEIAAGISQAGGTVDTVDGPFGPELRAQVPVDLPDGRRAVQPTRFIGVDGPRWFLRGLVTGPAAVDPAQAAAVEDVFRAVVVVRGENAAPPREPLPLRLPEGAGATAPDEAAPQA